MNYNYISLISTISSSMLCILTDAKWLWTFLQRLYCPPYVVSPSFFILCCCHCIHESYIIYFSPPGWRSISTSVSLVFLKLLTSPYHRHEIYGQRRLIFLRICSWRVAMSCVMLQKLTGLSFWLSREFEASSSNSTFQMHRFFSCPLFELSRKHSWILRKQECVPYGFDSFLLNWHFSIFW